MRGESKWSCQIEFYKENSFIKIKNLTKFDNENKLILLIIVKVIIPKNLKIHSMNKYLSRSVKYIFVKYRQNNICQIMSNKKIGKIKFFKLLKNEF